MKKNDNKNFPDDSVDDDVIDDDLLDDELEIEDIDDEFFDEFGDDEFDGEYDDRLEKVMDELSELKNNMLTGTGSSKKSNAAYSSAQSANEAALSNEVARLRDELAKMQNSQTIQTELNKLREEMGRGGRANDDALVDEIKSLKSQVMSLRKGVQSDDLDDIDADVTVISGASGSDIRKLYSELTLALSVTEQKLIDSIDTVSKRLDGEIKFAENEDVADVFQAMKDLRNDISNISRSAEDAGDTVLAGSSAEEVNLFLSEIVSLRDELQEYKDEIGALIDKVSGSAAKKPGKTADDYESENDNATLVLDELTSIRTEISNYTDELDALKSGISDIKNIIRAGVISEGGGSSNLETAVLLNELSEIKSKLDCAPATDENLSESISALRADVKSLADVKPESGGEEISQLKEEISELRKQLENMPVQGVAAAAIVPAAQMPAELGDALADIMSELHALRSGASEEIASLRAEVAELREKQPDINAAAAVGIIPAFDHDGANEKLMDEVRGLRDQLFAISMAKVKNGRKGEYENYNNILLDEIASLRDELEKINKAKPEDKKEAAKENKDAEKLAKEIKNVQDSLTALSRSVKELAAAEKKEVEKPAEDNSEIKAYISAQNDVNRAQNDVNKTIIAMLSEMLRLLEAQRVSAPQSKQDDTAVMNEIARLRDAIDALGKSEPEKPAAEISELEKAILILNEELAKLTALTNQTKPAAKEIAATKELQKTKEPKEKKAAPKKPAEKKKPIVSDKDKEAKKPVEKSLPPKKAEAKKPSADKVKTEKPTAKKKPDVMEEVAATKAKKPDKLADKQTFDEYVAELDSGKPKKADKTLRDILNFDDDM